MKNRIGVFRAFTSCVRVPLAVTCGLMAVTPSFATVLDDFNATQRSGWEDADPMAQGLPGGQQANGVFTFGLPPVGASYFVSSTKTSQTFELKEGRTVEFRVDMISGQGPDSYAVMGFIPSSTGANSLAGYGIAKSESDVLITKGINKYFIDDVPNPVLKNDNVTLAISLSVKSGSVYITGRILDRDANNQVIWERSFVDTSAADILGDGADDPPAPYITTGNFVLYLYGQNGTDPSGYKVVLDNAQHFVTDSTVLDDFNAAQRTGWEDADPMGQGLPGGQQANGVFTFGLPPVGAAYFVSSTKTTKTFSLDEGTRHEFAVDLNGASSPDAYAVLAFIPTSTGANSLGGYGLAKSPTDVLISKGINKYFIDDDTAPVKNDNVRLVLTLTVLNTNVLIRGQVLDKDNGNAVLWDKTFIDTPAADILGDGIDDPPAPFINLRGNVVLYLYANNGTDPSGYQVVLDNLTVAEPPSAANQPPIISGISPNSGAAFLTAPVTISFTAADDKALPDAGVLVGINGSFLTSTNGLVLAGPTTSRTATLSSGTGASSNYVAQLIVIDADGAGVTNILYFDTFPANSKVAEIEDYNFGGLYYNNPVPAPEGGLSDNSYVEQVGIEGVDFHDTQATPHGNDSLYRSQDPVRLQHSLDQARPKYDTASGIYGYDVGDIAADEWLNYTKDFDAGSYEVYLRESVVGFPQADSTLELVTGDTSQPNQSVTTLGSFLGKLSGFTFRNVPLTDGSGLNRVVLPLSGKTTLRLHQITADTSSSARYQNYLIFIPVTGVTVQRPTISSLQPTPDSTVNTVSPTIVAQIQNRDTSVNTNTIKLEVNGLVVSPTIAGTAGGATVTWAMTPLPASGAVNSAKLTFRDNEGVEAVTPWNFTVIYNSVNPAWRIVGAGKDRGINARVVQAQLGQTTENSLTFAEDLLRPGQTTYLVQYDTNIIVPVINFSQSGPGTTEGSFPDDELIPGLDPNYSTDDIAGEFTAYLELPAGKYRMGANSDDGYKAQVLPTFTARDTSPIAFHNGGPANETYDFVVSEAGLYPFRMVWYERGGGANVEWFQSNFTDGTRVLLNSDSAGTVKAFVTVNISTPAEFEAPVLKDGQLTIKWTGTGVLQESSDLQHWTDVPGQPTSPYTAPVGTVPGGKYYSLRQ